MENIDLKTIVQRVKRLEEAVFGKAGEKQGSKKATKGNAEINFQLNERAYVKRYAADKSGPKKFTLLLAYLAKGQTDKNIKFAEIRQLWNKMSGKSLLGEFNGYYPNAAKTSGWVDSKEHAAYSLTKEWAAVM